MKRRATSTAKCCRHAKRIQPVAAWATGLSVAALLAGTQPVLAGQCAGGLNYNPVTNARQPGFDYLCAGGDVLTFDFQRLLDGDFGDNSDDAFDDDDEYNGDLINEIADELLAGPGGLWVSWTNDAMDEDKQRNLLEEAIDSLLRRYRIKPPFDEDGNYDFVGKMEDAMVPRWGMPEDPHVEAAVGRQLLKEEEQKLQDLTQQVQNARADVRGLLNDQLAASERKQQLEAELSKATGAVYDLADAAGAAQQQRDQAVKMEQAIRSDLQAARSSGDTAKVKALEARLANATRNTQAAELAYSKAALNQSSVEVTVASLQADIRDESAKIANLNTKIGAGVSKLSNLQVQHKNVATGVSNLQKSYGKKQSIAGLPPDADLFDRVERMNWWSTGGFAVNDQWTGPTRSKNTTASVMFGGDMPVDAMTSLGFGVGYAHGSNEIDTVWGGRVDTNTLNLMLKGSWTPEPNIAFDATIAYSLSDSLRSVAATGLTDSYLVTNIGGGAGVSTYVDLAPDLRLIGRLGASVSANTRHASVDSLGVSQGENTNVFAHTQLSAKLQQQLPGVDGKLFVEGTLSLALVDQGLAATTSSPLTADFSAGLEAKLNDQTSFNASGFIGAIGRADQVSYGGSLGLSVSF